MSLGRFAKIGIVILAIGIALAVIPFKEETVETEYKAQISNWNVTWYYLLSEPTSEGYTENYLTNSALFIGNATFPAIFWYNWGDETVFGGFGGQMGFIARAELEMPVDGFVRFEAISSDGARLYIDGELVVDAWETRWGQTVGSGWATPEVEAGKHVLELHVYMWGWAVTGFETERTIMVRARKSEPLIGLSVACIGVVLIAVSRLRASTKQSQKT
ncbi:MAG: PA14 domain-containing protein [Candidatus Bathyarchaeia archaeon]